MMRRLVGRICICRVYDDGEGIWRSLGVWGLVNAQGLGRIHLQPKPPEQVYTIDGVFLSTILIALMVPT
jgi:hypothetical protein